MFSERPCLLDNLSQRTRLKHFFAEPEGHMKSEEMLRVNRKQTFEAILSVMRVVVNYRKGQRQLKRMVLHLKSTSAIYNGACHEKLWTASPGNPVGVTDPSLILSFVQPEK